jgi:hypothetical protein
MLVWWATTYKVYCCGAENDSFWLDPCAWECVGDSKPSGGELARVFGASPGALSSVSGGSKISQLRVPIWFAPVQRSSPGKAEQ